MTSTKWWWKKQKSTTVTAKNTTLPASSVKSFVSNNGADENASIMSLYSCGRDADSIFAQSTNMASSSIRAQHTRSEYSGNFSDIESNTSILSKPWISKHITTSIAEQTDEVSFSSSTTGEDEEEEEEEEDTKSVVSDGNPRYSSSSVVVAVDDTTATNALLDEQHQQRRRGSLADYFTVNKPLQGKLKAGFGKLIRSQTNDTNHTTQARRQSYS